MLVVAAVGTDKLHPRPRQRDVEDARVGGVCEVKRTTSPRLASSDRSGSPATSIVLPKRPIARASPPTGGGCDPSFLDQDIVEREQKLAVYRWPVIVVARNDEDVAVQAHLLAVVLTDVRVVPVRARIGRGHLVGKGLADRDRRLRLVRAVVLVPRRRPCQCTVASMSPRFVT